VTPARIGIIGDYDPEHTAHSETNDAIKSAAERAGIEASHEWVATDTIARDGAGVLGKFDGIWVAPGAPYRNLEGALVGIRYARESDLPLVGT
jgi:CTP synthase (UTP-ammonia lyase)